MRNNLSPMLSFAEEKMLEAQGYQRIAGIDEVGRGCLAGPVVAAAVIMPYHNIAPWFAEVNDCKLLKPLKRDFLYQHINEAALAVGIGVVSSEVIDAQGIIEATRLAMRQAIDRLSPQPESLLIDYMSLPEVSISQRGIKNGDRLCFSIACASIVAKVARDRLMVELDRIHPGYGLARHKGYGTREHLSCLSKLGPCPIHRQSFRPVREIIQREK